MGYVAPKGNKYAVGNKGGHPTTYKDKYIDTIDEFCVWCEKEKKLPSIARFSKWADIPRRTIYEWASREENREFSLKLDKIKTEAEVYLSDGGLDNSLNAGMCKFLLSSDHNKSEKTEQTVHGNTTYIIATASTPEELKHARKTITALPSA